MYPLKCNIPNNNAPRFHMLTQQARQEGKLFLHLFQKIAVFRRNKTIINDIKQIESLTIIGKYTANAALPHLLHPSSLF